MEPILLRAETERRFAAWHLMPNEHLPLLESLPALRPKSPVEVAARAVSACYVAAFCFGTPAPKVSESLKQFGLWQYLTTAEQELLIDPSPDSQSLAFHGWLIESIQFLAWSLGLVALDHFTECSNQLATHFPRGGSDPADFIAQAKLRPINELLQEADSLYMLHWRAVENKVVGSPDTRVVLPRVSFRRHAADWVIGVAEAWEEVPLDT